LNSPGRNTKDTKYFSMLPPEAKPPVEMNKAMMDEYRPALSKTYLNVAPRFN
jgi:aminobenzoyl-glutamate utilization protein B